MLHMAIVRSELPHARILSIDTSKAEALEGVVTVVTGEMLAGDNLAWMPTLSGDTQAVLATDKVRFQGQEVAAVIATDPYVARDAADLVFVDYEPLDAIVNPQQGLAEEAPIIRDDKEAQVDNVAYEWESGDAAATEKAFAKADRVVTLETHYPRSHPSPLETDGIIADVNPATGQATIYMTSQTPHVHRTVFALVFGLSEQNIRIISPDMGGGFGNNVLMYPGYVVATAASRVVGKPVKWVETRTENLISTGFAHDFYMRGELAVTNEGRILGLRVDVLSDQGAFYSDAQPTKFRVGLFHIVTGSYDFPAAHITAKGVYTNKAPGGVAYRSSPRVSEASYLIERLVQNAAYELGMDPAEYRMKNFIQPDQFPYESPTGLVYDSGDYEAALHKAMDMVDYEGLRREQAEARAGGRLMGIGIASFTEVAGAGPSRDYDILGLKMFDSAELRVHPTGKAILKVGSASAVEGDETTFAQIVAEELGIPWTDVKVVHGDTDNTPYGLGTYASRSTPTVGAATAMVSRELRNKARKLAAHLLEASEEDLEWETGKFYVKGSPESSVTIQDVAFAAYTNYPEDMEAGLEGVHYYDPPNMTYPFGSYIVVVDIDSGTGVWKVRRVVAVDDCGVRINPTIVEGQIHGGLAEGFAMSNMASLSYNEGGACTSSNFLDYMIPTAWETPAFELGETVTPSPHHPIGAKGVGGSATVGSPAAYVNAIIDALAHLGVRNIDMPVHPEKVWAILNGHDFAADRARYVPPSYPPLTQHPYGRIDRFGSSVRDATAVTIRIPEVLQELREATSRDPGRAHSVLLAAMEHLERDDYPSSKPAGSATSHSEPDPTIHVLRLAEEMLAAASEESDDPIDVTLIVSRRGAAEQAFIDLRQRALLIEPGSLRVKTLVAGPWKVAKLVALLTPRTQRTPEKAAASLLRKTRDVALGAGARNLPNLADDRWPIHVDLASATAAVIYVHGLLSVDVGQFDTLIEQVEAISPSVLQLGFAHNTLAPIDDNATLLTERIIEIVETRPELPIGFICHSRGGLVVRAALAKFRDSRPDFEWRPFPVLTFGTPHRGAVLASNSPEALLGSLIVGNTLWQRLGWVGTADAIRAASRPVLDRLKKDLRPPEAGGNEIIAKIENSALQPNSPMVYTVGGDIPTNEAEWWERLIIEAYHGKEPSDVIVELSSAVPDQGPGALHATAVCSHFCYFTDEIRSENTTHLRWLIEQLVPTS